MGRETCRNNPDCANRKDTGPVPPGIYDMIETEKYGGSYWLREGMLDRFLCSRFNIGRCEFFLHLGRVSAGCITVQRENNLATRQFDELRVLLRDDRPNRMRVIH